MKLPKSTPPYLPCFFYAQLWRLPVCRISPF